jgi:hypothetical protein
MEREQPIMTVPEFSEMMRVPPKRVYELLPSLPPGVVILLGRQVRINRQKAKEWIDRGGGVESCGLSPSVAALLFELAIVEVLP